LAKTSKQSGEIASNSETIRLRDAPKRREKDFVALFNALWYRDFPIIRGHEHLARRAMWTTHIASVVKGCADLMGFFTRFETGNRTGAVIQKPSGGNWARIEWEWIQPFRSNVNEFEKLSEAIDDADSFIFVGYSNIDNIDKSISAIKKAWTNPSKSLLVFLVTYKGQRKRAFQTVQTYKVISGKAHFIREQQALPWNVPDSRWEPTSQLAPKLSP
jgi:hypothetical protein